MRIETSHGRMSVLAPAKLNLFLEVLGKRSDGFHEIETVLCPISLVDRIHVEVLADSQICLDVILPTGASSVVPGDPAWDVPATNENLVVRAARLVQQQLGISKGCQIRLEKQIPSSAGLGGGSSDAAAAVVACLHLWNRWNRDLATSVCADLGSDVPFFLGAKEGFGIALGTGRGEQCSYPACEPKLEFVVLHPPVGCATSDVYTSVSSFANPRNAAKIIAACKTGQFRKIGTQLYNALQSPVERINAWVTRQLELLVSCGFEHALMTGSGSSCFALRNAGSDLHKLRSRAVQEGISRVYSATAWYAPSIEQQLGTPEHR